MSKKIHVRPGKGQSKVGFVAGLLFCAIGVFVVIPLFGPFGIVWTGMAALITFINYRNGVNAKYKKIMKETRKNISIVLTIKNKRNNIIIVR